MMPYHDKIVDFYSRNLSCTHWLSSSLNNARIINIFSVAWYYNHVFWCVSRGLHRNPLIANGRIMQCSTICAIWKTTCWCNLVINNLDIQCKLACFKEQLLLYDWHEIHCHILANQSIWGIVQGNWVCYSTGMFSRCLTKSHKMFL